MKKLIINDDYIGARLELEVSSSLHFSNLIIEGTIVKDSYELFSLEGGYFFVHNGPIFKGAKPKNEVNGYSESFFLFDNILENDRIQNISIKSPELVDIKSLIIW